MLYNFKFGFLQGYLWNFLAAYRMPPNSTESKRGIALLVAVSSTELSGAFYRSTKTDDRTA